MLVLSFNPDPGPLHLLLPRSQIVFPHGAPWFVLTPSPKCPPALSHFLPISLLPFPLRSYYLTNYIFHLCILFSLPHLLEYKLYEEGTIYFHLFPKYMPRAWESIVLNKYLLNKQWVIWIYVSGYTQKVGRHQYSQLQVDYLADTETLLKIRHCDKRDTLVHLKITKCITDYSSSRCPLNNMHDF